jgi:hypothetical protein
LSAYGLPADLSREPAGTRIGLFMPLTTRPIGLAPPVVKDHKDFTIYSGTWAVGRIYEERGGPLL